MSPDLVHQLETMLARIEERVKGIQEDIRQINEDRRCHTHSEKLRMLEKIVWSLTAGFAGLAARVIYEAIKQ
ncbi:hypothetical protein [Pseudodesulfovibrio pelocollis]|uniref:hypothetical protein n=1 Tax=Pseudodesulfovibrio pelocollis TaxID=3051432 RepID=UPI00255AB3C4|nr:hypothetical protein [Pseudodesulfovibrio sp. SB368]